MSGFIKITLACCLVLFGSVSARAASLMFDLQPVTICEASDPGTCQSTFDSNPQASLFDGGFLNAIFDQIDIAVNILPTVEFTSISLPRDGNGEISDGVALTAFKNTQTSLGVSSNTIYMGFTGDFFGSTIGLAFLDAPFSPFGVVQNTVGRRLAADAYSLPPGAIELFPNTQPGVFFIEISPGLFQQVIVPDLDQDILFQTAVLAHEIGHVLGAPHDTISGLLMSAVFDLSIVDGVPPISIISELSILDSAILTEFVEQEPPVSQVPLPAPFALLILGLFAIFLTKAWRHSAVAAVPSAA